MSSRIDGASSASGVMPYETARGTDEAAETHERQLLPAPFATLAGSADVGAQITALLVCASREQRQEAREARQAAETAQLSAEKAELSKMQDEANLKLASGIVSGGAQVAAGALTIGSAASAAESSTARALGGWATGTEAVGKLGGTALDYGASGASSAAKAANQRAGHAKSAVEDARDLDKDAKEMLNRALGYYKEYLTAKADTQRATLLKA
jgi:hypothetical protein